MTKAPIDLKHAGRRLWRQLHTDYHLDGNEFLVAELARTADRLGEIRQRMNAAKDNGEFVRLAGSEAKAAATAARIWRLLGLPQSEAPLRGTNAKN